MIRSSLANALPHALGAHPTAFEMSALGALMLFGYLGGLAVIADPDGGYLNRFYDPARGDVILNPFDPRAHTSDLYGEITPPHDVEELARSLTPDPPGTTGPQWVRYARTLFESITRQAMAAGIADLGELYRLLTAAPRHRDHARRGVAA